MPKKGTGKIDSHPRPIRSRKVVEEHTEEVKVAPVAEVTVTESVATPQPFQAQRGRQITLKNIPDGKFFAIGNNLFVRRSLFVDGVHATGVRIDGRSIITLEEITMGENTLAEPVEIV